MPSGFDNLPRGFGSSSSFSNLPAGFAAASHSKPKPKPRRWGGALLDNLEEFARGVGPGIAAIARAGYSDADKALFGVLPGKGNASWQTDDLGKAIAQDYKTRYAPLFRGDFKKFVDQVATRPLDFLLDAGAIATLGFGAPVTVSAKAVTSASKVGKLGAAEARIARLAGFVDRTPATEAAAARVFGKNSKEYARGAGVGLVRGVRTLGEGRYGVPLEKAVKMNPVLAKRDAGLDKVLGAQALDKAPLVGLDSRIARQDRKHPGLRADAQRTRMLEEPVKRLRRLAPDEQAAWFFLHTGTNPAEYVDLLKRTKATQELDAADALILDATIEEFTKPKVLALVAEPNKHVAAALEATRPLADEQMAALLQRVTTMKHRQILERRLLQERMVQGATRTETHPERMRAREGAVQRVSAAARDADAVRLTDGPDAPQNPAQGRLPRREDIDELLTREQRRLTHGTYAPAARRMREWLGEVYNDLRYGTAAPSLEQVRAAGGKETAARARAKRTATATTDQITTTQVDALIDKLGPGDPRIVRAIDAHGGRERMKLWRRVREARQNDAAWMREHALPHPDGSLERWLGDDGFDPVNARANIADDPQIEASIESWVSQRTGGEDLRDLAAGHRAEGAEIQPEQAAALIEQARHLDPDLSDAPDNSEIAAALADDYRPLSAPSGAVSRKEWVDRAMDAIISTYVHRRDHVDPDAELGRVRGKEARQLADRIGIRSVDEGIEPTGKDWAEAFSELARRAGFDDDYRRKAASLRGARERLDTEGEAAFAGEFEPVPLKDLDEYRDVELVNPETGRLYRDEDAARSDAEMAALAEGKSYNPHLPAQATRSSGGFGGVVATGAAKGTPSLPSNLTHASTGRRFETGTFSKDPMMLLQQAERLVRSNHAIDLYDAAVARGIPFNQRTWAETGGARAWVVLDKKGIHALNKRLTDQDATIREIEELLPEEQVTQLIEQLGDMSATIAQAVNKGELVMVPRGYYSKLTGDLKRSGDIARMLIDRPLDVFRTLTLFLRPAYYVNNIVGTHLLLAIKDHGPMFVPRYIQFLAQKGHLQGARAVFRDAVNDPKGGMALWDQVLEQHALELRGASAYDIEVRPGVASMTNRLAMSGKRRKELVSLMLRTPHGLNRFGAMLSDDLPRQFRFMRLMQGEVKAAKNRGEIPASMDDAAAAKQLLDADDVLRERVVERVLADLIDYRGMSSAERLHVRRVIPFYGWLRGISMWTLELGYDHPGQLLALAGVSTIGQDANAEWNERVPGFMQGAILVGGEHDGTQRVLTTQGLNPLGTIGDIAAMARGFVSDDPSRSLAGGTNAGQLNPFARVLAQSVLNKGKDFSSGFPMLMPGQTLNQDEPREMWNGSLMSALGGFIAGTPQAVLYANAKSQRINEQANGQSLVNTQGMYQSPISDYVWSYLGYPARNVDVAAAQDRRERDLALLAGVA